MPNLAVIADTRTARVIDAIRNASQRSGVDFGYMLQQARLESALNPDAAAPSSSATGLYQFINQSWLAMVREHGAEQGVGWAAQAIRRGNNGRYYVDDPDLRRQILDLRRNPELASSMAATLASDNRATLESHVSRPIENVDLYLAHFLGVGGATRFLTEHEVNPDAPAAPLFPAAARANHAIFFDGGRPRSLDEVRDRFARRMEASNEVPGNPTSDTGSALPDYFAQRSPVQIASATPQDAHRASILARVAYLTLAQFGG